MNFLRPMVTAVAVSALAGCGGMTVPDPTGGGSGGSGSGASGGTTSGGNGSGGAGSGVGSGGGVSSGGSGSAGSSGGSSGGSTTGSSSGIGPSQCSPDGQLQCAGGAYGYACPLGDDPTTYDSSLVCSLPMTSQQGDADFYCCVFFGGGSSGGGSSSGGAGSSGGGSSSGGGPSGCGTDPTMQCGGGATGYACTPGAYPGEFSPSLACSIPFQTGGSDAYCCFDWPYQGAVCQPDLLPSLCPGSDTYGFQCLSPNEDPTYLDSSLTCSTAVLDPSGSGYDYCCVYN
ncbi:MAG TPA: hypothetical protein VIF09_19360 [Polyangiaceae bacterium]